LLEDYEGEDKDALEKVGAKTAAEYYADVDAKYTEISAKVRVSINSLKSEQSVVDKRVNEVKVNELVAQLTAMDLCIGSTAIPRISEVLSLGAVEFEALKHQVEASHDLVLSAKEVMDEMQNFPYFEMITDSLAPMIQEVSTSVTRLAPTVQARVTSDAKRPVLDVKSTDLNRTGGIMKGGVHCIPMPHTPTPAHASGVGVSHSTPTHVGGAPVFSLGGTPGGAMGGAPGFHGCGGKAERLSLPKFSGKLPDWPEFKATWEDIAVMTGWGNRVLAQKLKENCKGWAAKLLLPVFSYAPDAYELQWAKLFEYYEHSAASVQAIFRDLSALRKIRPGNANDFIYFAGQVELAHSKLYQIAPDMPDKVTANQVYELVENLPDNYRIEWQRKYFSLSLEQQNNPFTVLSKFLCDEMSVLYKCYDFDRVEPRPKGAHGSDAREHLPKAPKGSKGGPERGSGRGKKEASGQKAPGRPKGSPGYKAGGQPGTKFQPAGNPPSSAPYCVLHPREDHNTWVCQKWLMLSGTEKRQTAKVNNMCFVCLHKSHGRAPCQMPVSAMERTKCKKPGCQGNPHSKYISCFPVTTDIGGASGYNPDGR
jgi:hypothetical protein